MKQSTKIKLTRYYLREVVAFVGFSLFFLGIGICDSSMSVGVLIIALGALVMWISGLDYICYMDEALNRVSKLKALWKKNIQE